MIGCKVLFSQGPKFQVMVGLWFCALSTVMTFICLKSPMAVGGTADGFIAAPTGGIWEQLSTHEAQQTASAELGDWQLAPANLLTNDNWLKRAFRLVKCLTN